MAQDVNQTIQDSRRAAMSFLNAAKAKEQNRKNRGATVPPGGGSRSSSAVDNFLSAGRRNEARANVAQNGGETDFDLAWRIRRMSDDEFNEALKNGSITPEQLRKAGEYEWDTYMGDVWSENADNDEVPEPTYDEFMANPEKYGVTYTDEDAAADPDADMYPVHWGRYKSTVKQQ